MPKQGRIEETLINPTWEQIVERDPLIAFSFYLSGRKNVLFTIADEIIENLDQGFAETVVDGGRLERAESLMWLWTFGAYEVVRTMCQSSITKNDILGHHEESYTGGPNKGMQPMPQSGDAGASS